MPFFWVLALWPVVEIALWVVVGGRIGVLATFAIILVTAALGVWTFRRLGRTRGSVSGLDAADHALLAVAAILLILPGFLTDGLGLLLLVSPLRRALIGLGAARLAMRFGPLRQAADRARDPRYADVIDAEYVDVTPVKGNGPSPWRDD